MIEMESPASRTPPARVLVVEDDPHIRSILETALSDDGYEVRVAAHGREGLSQLDGWPADVILLDLMLPVMDGWTFLAERRQGNLVPNARVVVLSASRGARPEELLEQGADAVIPKPFNLDTLLDTLADLTQRSGV